MIPDYHIHTNFSGDSDTPVREQLEQAVKLGMDAVCITDHHDYDVQSEIDFTLDFESYFAKLQELQNEYEGRLSVRIGAEIGLQKHLNSYIKEIISRYPFDFIIGSTHFVNGVDPYYARYYEGRSEQEAFREYFETLLTNVKEVEDYDVAGHLDYIIRYSPGRNQTYHCQDYMDVIDEILRTVISRGKGIECNTSGYRQNLGQPHPHPDILKRYRQLGGTIITIGSDAHCIRDLGADFEKARRLLYDCGFTHYTIFKRRRPEFIPL